MSGGQEGGRGSVMRTRGSDSMLWDLEPEYRNLKWYLIQKEKELRTEY